jgi:hypothetical protein
MLRLLLCLLLSFFFHQVPSAHGPCGPAAPATLVPAAPGC